MKASLNKNITIGSKHKLVFEENDIKILKSGLFQSEEVLSISNENVLNLSYKTGNKKWSLVQHFKSLLDSDRVNENKDGFQLQYKINEDILERWFPSTLDAHELALFQAKAKDLLATHQ